MPSTLTVLNNLDSGTGSLRAEIAAASSGDTIVFSPSLGHNTINLTSGELVINKNLTIQGPGDYLLSISGGTGYNAFGLVYGSRVFEVDGAGTTVTLSDLTLTNGGGQNQLASYGFHAGDGLGGAVLNYGTLTLSGCTVSNSTCPYYYAPKGGGIYNAGTLTVSRCTLAGNYTYDYGAGAGGGIFNAGSLTVSNSWLFSNSSDTGGGIYNDNYAMATVTGCHITGNGAHEGGGIFNQKHAKLTIESSIVTGNGDSTGVGADLYDLGTAKISNDSTVGSIGP
jgi:hypothetical protein